MVKNEVPVVKELKKPGMGQHGTRVGDVTMDSGEGWQWGVKTGRGR